MHRAFVSPEFAPWPVQILPENPPVFANVSVEEGVDRSDANTTIGVNGTLPVDSNFGNNNATANVTVPVPVNVTAVAESEQRFQAVAEIASLVTNLTQNSSFDVGYTIQAMLLDVSVPTTTNVTVNATATNSTGLSGTLLIGTQADFSPTSSPSPSPSPSVSPSVSTAPSVSVSASASAAASATHAPSDSISATRTVQPTEGVCVALVYFMHANAAAGAFLFILCVVISLSDVSLCHRLVHVLDD